jgi:uncharacterized protein (TIGR03083 family)
MDQAVLAANRASLDRLNALLDRLSDDDLSHPLAAGWTVGSTLAHLAFWDRRMARLVERWDTQGVGNSPTDPDIINDAMKPAWLALAPDAVRAESRAAAAEGDAAVARLSPAMWQAARDGTMIRLGRDKHRNEHIAEIEAALGQS